MAGGAAFMGTGQLDRCANCGAELGPTGDGGVRECLSCGSTTVRDERGADAMAGDYDCDRDGHVWEIGASRCSFCRAVK